MERKNERFRREVVELRREVGGQGSLGGGAVVRRCMDHEAECPRDGDPVGKARHG